MTNPTSTPRIFRFGAFEIDVSRGELRKHGLRVRIQQQPYQVLTALLERPGEVVTRDELVRRLWPEGTFVDFDKSLNAAVTRLRQTLSDSAENPRYVETVARQGYRLLTPMDTVMETGVAEQAAAVLNGTPAPTAGVVGGSDGKVPERHSRRPTWVYALSFGLLIAVGMLLVARRGPAPGVTAGYVQLTDLVDSAVAPVLSPDGRTVAFIRGTKWFLSGDQIWLKSLPDGEPIQLTRDPRVKFAPAFSPDGTMLAYSVVEASRTAWDTVVTPVLGGEPRLFMANAEGLTWLNKDSLLFSEIKRGIHMAVVTARENRTEARDLYIPEHERAMAHFSYASPDRKWILVIEMDHTAAFQSCRLVPFDGSSRGRQAGPPGTCTAAGWSPDGKWMYFTVATASGHHLWRQRFPRGDPEQLSFGREEAQGVAVAPDGQSVITSLGMRQSALWVHDPRGDRPISSVGTASSPKFSADGNRVFYLLGRADSDSQRELWVADLSTGKSERLVSGYQITSYDVSASGSEALLAVRPAQGMSQIWLASLDRRSPPVRIVFDGEDSPFFGADDQILFRKSDGKANYLFRMNRDGSGRAKVVPHSILNVMSVSPDGLWIAALVPVNDSQATFAEMAIPALGGAPKRICSGYCIAQWAPDMRHFYVTARNGEPGKRVTLPVPAGKTLPDLPDSGIGSLDKGLAISGDLGVEHSEFAPSPNPSVYAYVKTAMHRNLFRVPVP